MPDSTDLDLGILARQVRDRAYVPYSGYRVGAAIRAASGAIFAGANFENLSYGATICAERSAVAAMIAAGEYEIAEISVATIDGGTPCGICLQVLAEFAAPGMRVVCIGDAATQSFTLEEMAPHLFRSPAVGRAP